MSSLALFSVTFPNEKTMLELLDGVSSDPLLVTQVYPGALALAGEESSLIELQHLLLRLRPNTWEGDYLGFIGHCVREFSAVALKP